MNKLFFQPMQDGGCFRKIEQNRKEYPYFYRLKCVSSSGLPSRSTNEAESVTQLKRPLAAKHIRPSYRTASLVYSGKGAFLFEVGSRRSLELARFDKGWVKLHRKIENSWISEDGIALAVFTTLIRWANRKPSKKKFAGEVIEIQPGQILTSASELSRRLKFDRSAIERRLWTMTKDGTILRKSSNRGTLVTIANWELYQGCDAEVMNGRGTDDEQARNKRALSGEGKKERRKEDNYMSSKDADAPVERLDRSPVKELAKLWNELSGPKTKKIKIETLRANTKRYQWAKCRLRDYPDLEYWRSVIERISKSPFLTGDNNQGWTADFEFLIRQESHIKVMEGKYDGKSSSHQNSDGKPSKCPACTNFGWFEVNDRPYRCHKCDMWKHGQMTHLPIYSEEAVNA